MSGIDEHGDCVFCNIVAGKIPAAKVYEDEHALAFIDINPLAEGHMLLIPKMHCETIYEMPSGAAAAPMAQATAGVVPPARQRTPR